MKFVDMDISQMYQNLLRQNNKHLAREGFIDDQIFSKIGF